MTTAESQVLLVVMFETDTLEDSHSLNNIIVGVSNMHFLELANSIIGYDALWVHFLLITSNLFADKNGMVKSQV